MRCTLALTVVPLKQGDLRKPTILEGSHGNHDDEIASSLGVLIEPKMVSDCK